MDVAQFDTKVLAKWHITIAMHHKIAHNALAAQPQPSVAPFVIESHKVKVLLRVVDTLGNLLHEIRCSQQFARCIKKGHRSVDAYMHVHIIVFGNVDT